MCNRRCNKGRRLTCKEGTGFVSFVLIIIFLPILSTTAAADIPASERAALIALYNNTGGDKWDNNAGWKMPPLADDGFALAGTEGDWYGIKCNTLNTGVEEIKLNNNNLVGMLPVQLGDLKHVEKLHLSANRLVGEIPPAIGLLTTLREMDLHSNYFSGGIPVELGSLSNVYLLDLSFNLLSGHIPPELANLRALQRLDLSHNRLQGGIPGRLGEITELEHLSFSDNDLSGGIPAQLGDLYGLIHLDLAGNRLTGSIPAQLGKMENLGYLYLNGNSLSGSIPPEFGNIPILYILYLSGNRFEGEIPSQLEQLVSLEANRSDFRWNMLYTSNDSVREFLNTRQLGGEWESTQTIPPVNISASAVSSTAIEVSWTPIPYSGGNGGYRLLYSTSPGGPYHLFGTTETKYRSNLRFTGVEPFKPYYFVAQTEAAAHKYNHNVLHSANSKEVSAMTEGGEKIISGRVIDKEGGNGVAGVPMLFSIADENQTGSTETDGEGYYRYAVDPGVTVTIKPLRTGYIFTPVERTVQVADDHIRDIDFVTRAALRTISGYVYAGPSGLKNVKVMFTGDDGVTKNVFTSENGRYSWEDVPFGWTGTVTPVKDDLLFSPGERTYMLPGVESNLNAEHYHLKVSIEVRAKRETDNALLLYRDYGEIDVAVSISGMEPGSVRSFVLYRKEPGGVFQHLADFAYGGENHFSYMDKYLSSNVVYTYKVHALNNKGIVIGVSVETSI